MPARPKLNWLSEAVDDLVRHRCFLEPTTPEAAQRMARGIMEATRLLQTYPEAGRPLAEPAGFREWVFPCGAGAYAVRYRLKDDHLVLARIWYSRERKN